MGYLKRMRAIHQKWAPIPEILVREEKFLKCCEAMIQDGSNFNYVDQEGITPAMIAAYFRLESVLKLLEKSGAHMKAVDNYGNSVEDYKNAPHP